MQSQKIFCLRSQFSILQKNDIWNAEISIISENCVSWTRALQWNEIWNAEISSISDASEPITSLALSPRRLSAALARFAKFWDLRSWDLSNLKNGKNYDEGVAIKLKFEICWNGAKFWNENEISHKNRFEIFVDFKISSPAPLRDAVPPHWPRPFKTTPFLPNNKRTSPWFNLPKANSFFSGVAQLTKMAYDAGINEIWDTMDQMDQNIRQQSERGLITDQRELTELTVS